MIRPSLEEIRDLSKTNTIIPITTELFADIKTPMEVFKNLKAVSEKCYLLESVKGEENWGRYSFLGFSPKLTIDCKDSVLTITDENSRKNLNENPINFLNKLLKTYKSPTLDFLPPFTGGLVGYFSYNFIRYTQNNLKINSSSELGELSLMLFDKIVAFDHLRQKIMLIVNIETDDLENNFKNAVLQLKEMETIIKHTTTQITQKTRIISKFKPILSEENYCKKVNSIKKYIDRGEVLRVTLSNCFEAEIEGSLLSSYRLLRTIAPASYMFYLNFGDKEVTGSSPETLISIKNSKITSFPVDSSNLESKLQDEHLEIFEDDSALVEHNLFVDLCRNDIGKISELESINIVRKTDTKIISSISGTLRKDLNQIDAISAFLPPFAFSGAAKFNATKILSEIEEQDRGVYGGAIGYINFSGNMDLCTTIKTITKIGTKTSITVGIGITNKSIPKERYEKTLKKAKVVIDIVEQSTEVDNDTNN